LTAKIVEILEGLHSNGIIHRDLKPENLIIDERRHLQIIDFGTAEVFHIDDINSSLCLAYKKVREKYLPKEVRVIGDQEVSQPEEADLLKSEELCQNQIGTFSNCDSNLKISNNFMTEYQDNIKHRKSFVGTVYYVAPEMLENQEVDPGCDLWAFGIIINKMLTGDYLFNETNDYLTFEAIRKCEFKLQDDLPEDAKDLITKLIVKNPKNRLGNGPKGSESDFESLKSHPFFKGIDWSLLQTCSSPLKMPNNTKNEDDRESDFEENRFLCQLNGKIDKTIILTGLVKKMKYFFMYNTRQLVLYSDGTLEYLDPVENILKGRICLVKETKCFDKTENVFHVSSKEREFVFNTIDVPAKEWVGKIKEVLQKI
jgi:serine/threonine protein kinase